MASKTSKIKIENLGIFFARRKLKNVGAINVFKETASDSMSRSRENSSEEIEGEEINGHLE